MNIKPVAIDLMSDINIARFDDLRDRKTSKSEEFLELEAIVQAAGRQSYNDVEAELAADVADMLGDELSEWSKKVTATPVEPPSKIVTPRFRRSAANDLRTLVTIRIFERDAKAGKAVSVSNVHTPISTPKIALETSVSPTSLTPIGKRPSIPVWEKTSDPVKITFINRAAYGGYAFSLNMTESVIEKAKQYPDGFAAYFKDEIDRYWKKVLPSHPSWWFHVDVCSRGRLHLHGAFQASVQEIDAIRTVMCAVGGQWRPRRHKSKDEQFDFRLMDEKMDVWSRYCMRNAAKVSRMIDGPLYAKTQDLSRLAKGLYGQVKRKIDRQ